MQKSGSQVVRCRFTRSLKQGKYLYLYFKDEMYLSMFSAG